MLASQEQTLISPYGGKLVDLLVPQDEVEELTAYANRLPSIRLTHRNVHDLELLAVGAFSPLDRFMGKADFQSVLDNMRLANGYVFPMPIQLAIDDDEPVKIGQDVALRDPQNDLLAVMTVEEIYEWDLEETAIKAFGKNDLRHPIVAEMHRWGKRNISGPIRMLHLPRYYDFKELRLTPAQTRARLETYGHTNVVAFQTRNPMHRVHEELTKRAIAETDGVLLLHPVVGMTKPGDVDYFTRVRTYRALANNFMTKIVFCFPCCRWLCAWAARAKRCGTRSSGVTTAPIISSSAATTPVPAKTRMANPSTGRTMRRTWLSSSARRSA
jgi:sulfate adenylyltransferase